jgi:predicted lipid carrier protein YhbT
VARVTRGHPDEHLLRLFGSTLAQRAILTATVAAFRPSMALGFEGEIVFELLPAASGHGPDTSEWWTIEVRDGGASLHHRRGADPAATLRLGIPDLVRLVSGELDPLTAIVDWRVVVEGDVLVASRLTEMFGAVEPPTLPAIGDGR